MQISPEDRPGNALGSVQEMVVIVPVDADVNEAQDVTQKDRHHGAQGLQRWSRGHSEIQDHDRNNDGEDAVAKGFETALIHRGEPASRWGRLSRIASATSSRRSSVARSHFARSA